LKQNKINKEMPYYLYIHNIYLYQYHDTKPNPINIDRLLRLTPTRTLCIVNGFAWSANADALLCTFAIIEVGIPYSLLVYMAS